MANTTTNIWESLLKESSKRVQLPDGAVLFLGSASCGKSALVSRVCADSDGPADEDMPKIPDITAYDSFVASDMDEAVSDGFSSSRVGVWSISEKSFKGAAALVLHPYRIERLVVMIGVDLSKPTECRENLLAWLKFLRHQLENCYFKELSAPEASVKINQNKRYLSGVREKANMVEMADLLHDFGVPLVVVGCKADSLVVKDLAQLKKNDEAQREIRNICMKVGAGLIYTCANTGKNCALLKKYILHRLYNELFPMDLAIEHTSSELFIPAGLDTEELVAGVASAPGAEVSLEQLTASDLSAVENPFSEASSKSASEENGDGQQALLEDEQQWLTNLHMEIEAAAASQITPSLQGAGAVSFDQSSLVPGGADKPMSLADKILAAGAESSTEAKPVKARRNSTMTQGSTKKQTAPDDVKGFFESLMK